MIYLPAIVSVTCYFEKYRSLATGIAVCGSGLGTFIFSPLIDYLVVNRGWTDTLIVISGLVLMCTVFGMLFRPLSEVVDDEAAECCAVDVDAGAGPGVTVMLNVIEPENQPLNGCGGSRSFDHLPDYNECVSEDEESRRRRERNMAQTNAAAATAVAANEVNESTFGNDLDKQSRFTLSQPELLSVVPRRGDSHGNLATANRRRHDVCYASQNLKPAHANGHGGSGIMYQKDIFYSGSLRNIAPSRRRYVYRP